MGGPSAALVLADLVELGVRRAIRVGTCNALHPDLELGELVIVTAALPWPNPGDATALPDPGLTEALAKQLDNAQQGTVASLDTLPLAASESVPAAAADMQTATLLARGRELGAAVAAVLIVAELGSGERIGDEEGEQAAKRAGRAATAILSG
jgi:uridine phosphorylase